jgi:hypothetical protein
MSLTKKLVSTKVATVAVGLAMMVSLVAAAPASAQTTTDLQAQISALLAQIAALQAQLNQTTGGTTGGTSACTFTRDLTIGATGADVTCLQQSLIAMGHAIPAGATGYFGAQTRAAVSAWQTAKAITPTAGYFGPKSRAAFGSGTGTGTGTGTIPSGSALSVMKAATSPMNVALIQGQAIADLAHFTITNPTATEASITNMAFDRIGVSNDTTLTNVFLYQGATRLTDSASVSSSRITFNDAGGILKIPAGGSVTISVRADILTGTAGQIVGVQLVSLASNVALASTVSLPIAGNVLSIASATLAGVNYNTTTTPAAASIDPQDAYTMWSNNVSITTRAVDLHSMTFRQIGSVQSTDLRNFKLLIDGTQVGSVVAGLDSRGYVTFDFSAAPIRLQTGTRVIKLLGDVVGGSTRTFSFSLRQAGDGMFLDSELKQAVLAQANSTTFSARTTGDQTVNAGTLTLTKKTTSPSGNVILDASNVTLGAFDMKSAGERLKVESLTAAVLWGGAASTTLGLRNGALFVNGVQVGSTATLSGASTGTQFNLGSSLILEPGAAVTLEVKADIYNTSNPTTYALATGQTIAAQIVAGSSNIQRLNALTYASNSAVTANTLTLATGSVSGSKYASYANQTVVVPKTAQKLAEFRVVADSTESVNVNTLTLDFTGVSTGVASNLTDVYIMFGSNTSSIKSTVASTSNAWNVNYSIPANSEVAVTVYGTLGAGFNDTDTLITSLTTAGTTANSAASATTGSVTGQTLTVSTGSFASENVSDASLATRQLVGNTTSPKVASFRFTATNDDFTITELAFKVGSTDNAGGINSITLKSAGMTDKTFSLNGLIGTSTGLSLNVPSNNSSGRVVDVYLNLNAVNSSAGTSSNNVQITLDTFKGLGVGSGTETTDGTDRAANANYVFASVPTLTNGVLTDTEKLLVPGSGRVLARVKVTADAAGQIDWKKIVFTMTKSAGVAIGATSTVALWNGASQIDGTFSTSTASTVAQSEAFAEAATSGTLAFVATDPQQISAGQTATYELRGTIGGTLSGTEFVSFSIANPSTSRTAPNLYSVIAGAAGTQTPSFVWSDRSANSHSVSTADWNNDYLVENLVLSLDTVINSDL